MNTLWNAQAVTDTEAANRLVFKSLSNANLAGVITLRTVAAVHTAYFNCSSCLRILQLLNSGPEPRNTLTTATAVHFAGHWNTTTDAVGTSAIRIDNEPGVQ